MALTRATGVISVAADPAAGDEVTIGDQTYVFDATPANANEVDVGADRDGSISNLVSAINADGTAGAYDEDTVENPYVYAAADLANDEIDLFAKVPGTIGNGIFLGTSETDIVIGGSPAETTMTGGVGSLEAELESMQLKSDALAVFRELFRDR